MLSNFNYSVLPHLLIVWLLFTLKPRSTSSQVNLSGQLLDCTELKPTGARREGSSCIRPDNVTSASAHETPKKSSESTGTTQIFSINFNNILKRRHARESSVNCTDEDIHKTNVICTAKNQTIQAITKPISINIVPNITDQLTIDALALKPNTTNVIQCQFSLSPWSNVTELDFKLRWLRSITSQHGLNNQSISSDAHDNSLFHSEHSIFVSASQISTAQRQGGLDLVLNDATASDSGDYFCQAVAGNNSVLDEKRIHIEIHEGNSSSLNPADRNPSPTHKSRDRVSFTYSDENLEKLLPSLHVVPDYAELAIGESIQLACVTMGLDPDPDPDKIEWTFEPFERPGYVPAGVTLQSSLAMADMPSETTQLGNILTVWSMSHETIGVYKCSYHLEDMNLTAEANGELALRPNFDMAPFVYMTPELLRLSARGSARIQCESTGYPPPEIEWFRVDASQNSTDSLATDANVDASQHKLSSLPNNLDGLEVKKLQSRDVMSFCIQEGCRTLNNLDQSIRNNQRQNDYASKPRTLVTGLSWIQINQAQAVHQGQYVCRATNKHGTHQASSIIDVEFKEPPLVEVARDHTSQIIVLDEQGTPAQSHSIEFNCSIKAGQPKPQLKWLRMNRQNRHKKFYEGSSINKADILDNYDSSAKVVSTTGSQGDLEIYDLTTVSSATSRVSTQSYGDNTTLVLQLSTISVDDEGDYICLGENEVGRHSAVAQLQVRKLPKVRISPASPKTFRPNESFQLDCIVTGHPVPIDIEWSRSDRGAFFALIPQNVPTISFDQARAILRFDRVRYDDSGEYTCAARDPTNPTIVLKDTIMLIMDENLANSTDDSHNIDPSRLIPKLLVRPTKITAEIGSDVTLDCLTVSGLQPTIVEWLAPSTALTSVSERFAREHTPIRPYYRNQIGLVQDGRDSSLLQFGPRLRLFNVSKAHQGVYQCKGKNRMGVENAPAFVEIIEKSSTTILKSTSGSNSADEDTRSEITKTKIAKMGANIELRCQVNGADGFSLATSWSRENRELPTGSVQIGHNLWLQNLSEADNGLYLCSARSNEPNEILQAKIRLLVNENERLDGRSGEGKFDPSTLDARIIPSKVQLVEGDSVTLECVISPVDVGLNSGAEPNHSMRRQSYSANDLADLERQVIWTNLQSGQSLFQDNVYIQGNLLIIYGLKRENSATYRCNYNDLSQHTEYKLIVAYNASEAQNSPSNGQDSMITGHLHDDISQENLTRFLLDNYQMRHVIAPVGSRKMLQCTTQNPNITHHWTFDLMNVSAPGTSGNLKMARNITNTRLANLTLDQVDTDHAGVYQCYQRASANSSSELDSRFLVEVPVVAAKFVQRPVSFITLPAVSDADHRLEIELKFYPESDHGLMLFSGGLLSNLIDNQHQFEADLNNRTTSSIDYVSLGLVRGYLEFRFELGDGSTLVRSPQPIGLNRWHKILIERSRRSAFMWLNGQAIASNTSAGKFFNLNLDSLLYVGGHQVFLSISGKRHSSVRNQGETSIAADRANQTSSIKTFYGFSQGFRGCISSLRINQRDLILMDRNRSVTVGIFECDKPECPASRSQNHSEGFECNRARGFCQVDRSPAAGSPGTQIAKRLRSHPNFNLRCICYPNFTGIACNETSTGLSDRARSSTVPKPSNSDTDSSNEPVTCNPESGCHPNGTIQCEQLSSTSYRCHCRIGFMGEICDQSVTFDNETSVGFNHSAFIQFAFRPFQEFISAVPLNTSQTNLASLSLNELDYAKLTTFTEQQNITFRVKTLTSYGLLFYIGQDLDQGEISAAKIDTNVFQASKSIVANLLSRLTLTKVGDFLALALVDGHIELSYELGSGLAVLRSSKRYNDGLWHKIEVLRQGKATRLILDDSSKHEIKSPGKLSMLNVGQDVYLGGLPVRFLRLLSAGGSSSTGSLLSTFTGCLSDLQINSLGPLTLIRSDRLTQLKAGRNLVACGDGLLSAPRRNGLTSFALDDKIANDRGPIKPATTTTTPATTILSKKTTKRPTKPSYTTTESYGDDSDELASSS